MPKTYKIGEAAALLNLKTYVLRFWETEFPQINPLRTDKGQRLYTEEHIALLRRIRFLLHERGLTIEGARKALMETFQASTYALSPFASAPALANANGILDFFVPTLFPPALEKALPKQGEEVSAVPVSLIPLPVGAEPGSLAPNDRAWVYKELTALVALLRKSSSVEP